MREENGNTRRKKRKQNFGNAAHSYARINEQNSHFDIHIRAIYTMIRYGGTVRGSKWGKCLSDANGKFVSLLYFVDSSKAFLNLIFVRYWPMNGFTFAFHPPATILNDGNRVSKFELNIIENLINSEGLFYFILAFESSLLFLIFFFLTFCQALIISQCTWVAANFIYYVYYSNNCVFKIYLNSFFISSLPNSNSQAHRFHIHFMLLFLKYQSMSMSMSLSLWLPLPVVVYFSFFFHDFLPLLSHTRLNSSLVLVHQFVTVCIVYCIPNTYVLVVVQANADHMW